jgi:hypothetical protein
MVSQILHDQTLVYSSRFVVNYEGLLQCRQELICKFGMFWVFNVLLDSFCTFKCGLKDMCEPLMHVFYAHISSPANHRAYKKTGSREQA